MANINDQLVTNIHLNNIDKVIELLDDITDIDEAIYVAIHTNNYEITKLLLDRGININNDGYFIVLACEKGHHEIMELLLKSGLKYNTKTRGSLLGHCVIYDDIIGLKLLIQYGIEKFTPLKKIWFDDQKKSLWDICLQRKTINILEFIISDYPHIIPNNNILIEQEDIQKYNFVKMLINKNLIDIAD